MRQTLLLTTRRKHTHAIIVRSDIGTRQQLAAMPIKAQRVD
jgi:hypothetical protein